VGREISEAEIRARFERIERTAYERHVLELVRGYATEHDRLDREHGIYKERYEIPDAEIDGEYPDTCIRLRRVDRHTGKELSQRFPLWLDDSFRNSAGEMYGPEHVAADILIQARGG
jgi:hypothetical protein